MKTTKTNMYAYITVALVAVVVIITGVQGTLQVSERRSDYEKYMKANATLKSTEKVEDKDIKKVIKDLDALNEKYGEVPNLYMDKANAYYKLEEYDKALDEMKKCFAMEETVKEDSKIIYLYGKVAYLSGDVKEAKNAINKAIELGILNQNIPEQDKKFIEDVIKE